MVRVGSALFEKRLRTANPLLHDMEFSVVVFEWIRYRFGDVDLRLVWFELHYFIELRLFGVHLGKRLLSAIYLARAAWAHGRKEVIAGQWDIVWLLLAWAPSLCPKKNGNICKKC